MKAGKFVENLFKFLSSNSDRSTSTASESENKGEEEELCEIAEQEPKQFSLEALAAATQDFHPKQKLGEGGFGPVYKGKLVDGREIAVKKLSRESNQGRKEFMNEAMLLARVQHRNVVSLLGYCAHGAEKLLVYEYVPNESLDKLLFYGGKRGVLDWKKRYDVIVGVARGLVYLHEDSHCCIIHRDIKASNILLDDKWSPKIADFGMARLYPEDQTHVRTRIAGTNGYMAPEYAIHGQLSVKVDVFSYGVLVMELISGRRNLTLNNELDARDMLQWAWKLYKKGQALDIIDPTLASTTATDQVLQCIQIGLLCTQADPKFRPTMRRVAVMLSKKPGSLGEPTKPGYPGVRYRRSQTPVGSSSDELYSQTATLDSASTTNTNMNIATISTNTMSPRPPKEKSPIDLTSNPNTSNTSTDPRSPIPPSLDPEDQAGTPHFC